jgi:hypothetical protein
MNKYQKQIYKIAKWSYKAVLKNSNINETFDKHYKGIKRNSKILLLLCL